MIDVSGDPVFFRYKTDDNQQNKKLDEMDLDDILNKAESHETEDIAGAQGASSGGEGFLAQFAAIQDVKNDDLSWEDIIPVDEREKAEQEERERQMEEERKANEPRKRAAAPAPGAFEGTDGGDRASPDEDVAGKTAKPQLKKPKVMPPKRTVGERANFLKGEYCMISCLTRDSGVNPFANPQSATSVCWSAVSRSGVIFVLASLKL